MRTFSQFMTVCLISSPAFSENLIEYYYGDSIAVGYGGRSPGSRRVGASPSEVLSYIERDLKDNPNKFRGQTVNISTGVSNNPSDFKSIERQLARLSQSGAKINVLGAAQGRYDKENERLSSLSSRYGATFRGGFKPGRDGVHPASYGSYERADSSRISIRRPSAASPQPSITKKVLAKLKGKTGELDKITGKFKERSWNDNESSRYKSYGGK